MYQGPLGAVVPEERPYITEYPMAGVPLEEIAPTPMVAAINWYTNYDSPQQDSDGRWWIGKGSLGSIRGAHAICLKDAGHKDFPKWWMFYNQGLEGACVGFAESRVMSLFNRVRYDAFWLYRKAQERDGIPGKHEGTSLDAAFQVLLELGHVIVPPGVPMGQETKTPKETQGIKGIYRWTSSVDEVLTCLGMPLAKKLGAVPFLNSWGALYPRLVWIPGEVLQKRGFDEYGEAAVMTDR